MSSSLRTKARGVRPSNAHTNSAGGIPLPRELLVFVPLLGSALAVAFDVGYSTGLDLRFFTFFSLTEHITFALEALPFAFLWAAVLVVLSHLAPRAMAPTLRTVARTKFGDKLKAAGIPLPTGLLDYSVEV